MMSIKNERKKEPYNAHREKEKETKQKKKEEKPSRAVSRTSVVA